MKGIAVESLAGVVGIIILSLLLIGLLVAGGDLGKMFPEMVIGNVPKIKVPISFSTFGVETVDMTGLGLPMTATEVGCSIAKTIRDDFAQYGESNSAGRGQTLVLNNDLRVISAKRFSIGIDNTSYNDLIHYWESRKFSSDQRIKLAEACGLDTNYLADCQQHLDEACVSLLLYRMKIGEKKLCTDEGTINVGGENVKFGNEKCDVLTKTVSKDWVQDCIICKGGDRIGLWMGGGADYYKILSPGGGKDYTESIYKVKDVKTDAFPPGYQNCTDSPWNPKNCVPDYMYVLYWDTENKQYHVSMPRIPKGQDIGTADPTTVSKDLGTLFKDNDYKSRSSPAGLLYSELRMIRNITFKPSQRMLINDFAGNYITAIQEPEGEQQSGWPFGNKMIVTDAKWTYSYDQCDGPDCYVSMPKVIEHKIARTKVAKESNSWTSIVSPAAYLFGQAMGDLGDMLGDKNYVTWSQLAGCGNQTKKDNEDYKSIQVHSNLAVNEEYLEPNKTYNVIVTYWTYNKAGSFSGPSCGAMGVPGECKFCVKGCGDATSRWSYDCTKEGGASFDQIRTDRLFFDYSLIIVDTERLEAFYNVQA